ncbi:MAG: hypothetical protein ACYTEQ_07730, partial [Planctomycetota bacterium]
IGPEEVLASQRGHVRRKRELIYMRRGIHTQTVSGKERPSLAERVTWWMQRRTQKRSKKAWANYGRKYGRFAFWLAVTDLLLMQSIANTLFTMTRLPNSLIRKCRKLSVHST